MDEFSVYKMYLALKLHFTTDKYDAIQQRGKVRASRQAFAKRNDLYSIKKVSKTYSDEEVANFLVANFVSGDRWGGIFDSEAGERYLDWKRKMESLGYIFSNEIDRITTDLENNNKSFSEAFKNSNGQHPYIIRSYLRKDISIETLVILDKVYPFLDNFDIEITDKILWPDISRLIRKYKPFLKFNEEKFNGLLRRRIGHNATENT